MSKFTNKIHFEVRHTYTGRPECSDSYDIYNLDAAFRYIRQRILKRHAVDCIYNKGMNNDCLYMLVDGLDNVKDLEVGDSIFFYWGERHCTFAFTLEDLNKMLDYYYDQAKCGDRYFYEKYQPSTWGFQIKRTAKQFRIYELIPKEII